MNPWLLASAALLCIAGAMLLYVASPQQQLRARGHWPARRGWWPGALCALASLVLVLRVLPPVEAVSAWVVLLTLVLSVAPFLGAWRARVRAGKPA
jgi:cell division protein FtsW (lipid II flippase)